MSVSDSVFNFVCNDEGVWSQAPQEKKLLYALMNFSDQEFLFCMDALNWDADLMLQERSLSVHLEEWGKHTVLREVERRRVKQKTRDPFIDTQVGGFILDTDGQRTQLTLCDQIKHAFHNFTDQEFLYCLDSLGWDVNTMMDDRRLVVQALLQGRNQLLKHLYLRGAGTSGKLSSYREREHLFRMEGISYQQNMCAYEKARIREIDLLRINIFVRGVQKAPPTSVCGRFYLRSDCHLFRVIGSFIFCQRPWDADTNPDHLKLNFVNVINAKRAQKRKLAELQQVDDQTQGTIDRVLGPTIQAYVS